MSKIQIRKIGITELKVDAIVNAANPALMQGGGVCGAIFEAAGAKELTDACMKINGCPVGGAVITPGFKLNALHIIHAVGPQWINGNFGEADALYDAYMASLRLARDYGCQSIGFPLISAGIYGYPKEEAWEVALTACLDYLSENSDYNLQIIFAVIDDEILEIGLDTLGKIKLVNKKRAEKHTFITIEDGELKTYQLEEKNSWQIGRATSSETPDISYSLGIVSRKHGSLEKIDSEWVYIDNNPTNGTTFNGQRIFKDANGTTPHIKLKNKDNFIFGGEKNGEFAWGMFTNKTFVGQWRVMDTKGYPYFEYRTEKGAFVDHFPEVGKVLEWDNAMVIYMKDKTYLIGAIELSVQGEKM